MRHDRSRPKVTFMKWDALITAVSCFHNWYDQIRLDFEKESQIPSEGLPDRLERALPVYQHNYTQQLLSPSTKATAVVAKTENQHQTR